MKIINSESSMKKIIHLDLLGSQNESRNNLITLSSGLEKNIEETKIEHLLTFTNEQEYTAKFAEMMGHKLSYSISESCISEEDSFHVSNEIVSRLNTRTKDNGNNRFVAFPNREEIAYNKKGEIIYSTNQNLIGKNSLEYISCNIHEDFGVVMLNQGKLVYSFDSAMFEKTPKDIVTGKNLFIGKDFLEFHKKAKTFGHILPSIFGKMINAFSEKKLDMLTIDLRGANVYSNGNIDVRRFERDYAVPIMQPEFKGIIVYTDVFFQNVNENKSPLEGGGYIKIDSPIKFANDFKVK